MTSTSPARILRAAPYFLVPDVAAAGTYYREVLGFQCEYDAGEPPEFAIYSRSGSPVMLRRASDPGLITPNEKQGGTWDVFCWVEALDPLVEELEQRGATFVYPPVVHPYGMREFAVRDPSGYVLGFGEEWPVKRAAAGAPPPAAAAGS
jgi:catechol 2,3-dioxygenase-like lactoylglutathione lyase family enzyme